MQLVLTHPNNQTVYVYEKAFPGALTERLRRMYIVGVTSDSLKDDFYSFKNLIPYVDFLGTLEYEELSVPDDYYSTANIPVQSINGTPLPTDSFEHLELVNARQAWHLSTGDPNIAIGVVDAPINPNHPDLINKVIQHYGSIPSSFPAGEHHHGTKVAGSAATDTDNSIGISSIGYNTSLVTYASNHNETGSLYTLPQKMLYIVQNHPEIKVITHSRLESCNFIQANALVYEEIWEQYDVTVITAAGNGNWKASCPDQNGGEQGYVYPASYDHVISVSTVGHNNIYGSTNSQNIAIGWKDVHEYMVGNNYYTFTHNDKVDVVAPGYGLPTTNLDNEYATGFGTSFSGPFVCGIAALMYDVNPNITPDQVLQILKDTAEESIYDIPENTPYIGLLGAGRVNAFAAVLQAKCLYSSTPGLDLVIRNSKEDFGQEPDNLTNPIWNSPNIWVRNQPDGRLVQEHQDLYYINSQTPVYVYIKVTNNSCETSLGTEQLYLYWAKGGLSQVWPMVWTGSFSNGLPTGDNLGNQAIPVLAPGESTVLEFQWFPENPDIYENEGFSKPWMFCFLARIVAPNDPMTFGEGTNAATNTRNNNNIAYKNTTVLNVVGPQPIVGTTIAGNLAGEIPVVSDIRFFTLGTVDAEIWQEAEVWIELDDFLWNRWQQNGSHGNNIQIINEEQHRILLTGNEARLNDINFQTDEWGLITLGANFLIEEVDSQEKFSVHVEQLKSANQESMGGFTYQITRDNTRPEFYAEGKREEINNTITLKASSINEPAIYNWYNAQGELVYSGKQLTLTDPVVQEYKLEIIASSDGHKDYAMVNSGSPYDLESLSPNPASDQLQVNYQIQGAASAYISLTSIQTTITNNYILDTAQPAVTIDLSDYAPAIYVVTLVCDGKVIESKNLIVQ